MPEQKKFKILKIFLYFPEDFCYNKDAVDFRKEIQTAQYADMVHR